MQIEIGTVIRRDIRGRYTRENWINWKLRLFKMWAIKWTVFTGKAVVGVTIAFSAIAVAGQGVSAAITNYMPQLPHSEVAAANSFALGSVAFAGTTTFADKVKNAQNEIINEISMCETHGVKEADAAIILDTNNQMSIGHLMFQIATVQMYEKEMTGQSVDRVEAINIATDHEKSTELARYIIFTDRAWANWLNCSNKLDIGTQVKLLNKLTT